MIEVRPLTKHELNDLVQTAPESETRFVKQACEIMATTPFEFFREHSQIQTGILSNGWAIYQGAIMDNGFWTIVNSDVKEQFTLFKVAKRKAHEWAKEYGTLTATMHKGNEKNTIWTERLGFKRISENEDTITLELAG